MQGRRRSNIPHLPGANKLHREPKEHSSELDFGRFRRLEVSAVRRGNRLYELQTLKLVGMRRPHERVRYRPFPACTGRARSPRLPCRAVTPFIVPLRPRKKKYFITYELNELSNSVHLHTRRPHLQRVHIHQSRQKPSVQLRKSFA